MKTIDTIIIHCSATKEGVDIKAADIDRMHKAQGWKMIGYNYVVDLDGTIEEGRPLTISGAHCNSKDGQGSTYNTHSIGICYIGGLDSEGKIKDTRTPEQKASLINLINELCSKYQIVELMGHRDTSPDFNNNGEIESFEWIKACPCFDVKSEYPSFVKNINIRL